LAKLPQDFTDLLIELCGAKAEFLLVGDWAVILYGHVRATDDMDIFVRPTRGEAAISLAPRLTIESSSLAGMANARHARDSVSVRFVPRTPA
jgi:hypothetical protein